VNFNQAGNTNYAAAALVSESAGAQKANQAALMVIAPSNLIYPTTAGLSTTGGSSTGAVTYDVGDSTACTVAVDILSLINGSGTCNITATKAADDNYNATTGTISGTVTDGTALFIGAIQGIGFGSLSALSFLMNHKLFDKLFRRRRKQKGSHDRSSKEG
jgi:hypothetical protein